MATPERTSKRRAHILLPLDLVEQIDAQVGPRGRSRYIQEAVEDALARRRLKDALREMEGSLAGYVIPGWETPEDAAEWVRAMRRGDDVDAAKAEAGRPERAG